MGVKFFAIENDHCLESYGCLV